MKTFPTPLTDEKIIKRMERNVLIVRWQFSTVSWVRAWFLYMPIPWLPFNYTNNVVVTFLIQGRMSFTLKLLYSAIRLLFCHRVKKSMLSSSSFLPLFSISQIAGNETNERAIYTDFFTSQCEVILCHSCRRKKLNITRNGKALHMLLW